MTVPKMPPHGHACSNGVYVNLLDLQHTTHQGPPSYTALPSSPTSTGLCHIITAKHERTAHQPSLHKMPSNSAPTVGSCSRHVQAAVQPPNTCAAQTAQAQHHCPTAHMRLCNVTPAANELAGKMVEKCSSHQAGGPLAWSRCSSHCHLLLFQPLSPAYSCQPQNPHRPSRQGPQC